MSWVHAAATTLWLAANRGPFLVERSVDTCAVYVESIGWYDPTEEREFKA